MQKPALLALLLTTPAFAHAQDAIRYKLPHSNFPISPRWKCRQANQSCFSAAWCRQ